MMMMPLGFRFYPTKEELISDFLVPWVTGTRLPWDGVVIKALYSGAPWDVFSDGEGFWQPNITEGGDTNKSASHVYIFTKLVRNPTKIQRTAGGGTWGGQTGPKDILDSQSGETIGHSRMYSYQHGGASSEYGHWIMHEYVLSKRMLKMIRDVGAKDMVICKITRTFKNSVGGGARHQPPQPQQFIPPAIVDSRMHFFPPATPDSLMQFVPPATDNSHMQFFPPPAIDEEDGGADYIPIPPFVEGDGGADYIPIQAFVEEDGGADYIPIPSNKRVAQEDRFQELHEGGNKKQKLMDDEGGANSLEGVPIPEVLEKADYSCLESASENSVEAASIPELEKEDDSTLSWIYSVVDFEEPISQALETYENDDEVPLNSHDDFSDVFGIRRGQIC